MKMIRFLIAFIFAPAHGLLAAKRKAKHALQEHFASHAVGKE